MRNLKLSYQLFAETLCEQGIKVILRNYRLSG